MADTPQNVYKVIIAGGRDFNNYAMAEQAITKLLSKRADIEIVSGCCDDEKKGALTFVRPDGIKVYGADGIGERYAHEHNHPVKYFPANWKKFGKPAGPLRNKEMADYGNALILFYNGYSKGSRSMLELAKDLPTRIIKY